ncbi:MAG: hypothetical protein IH624_18250 [Phycisphaerae bacterium]|nr:hypothetical protein [Phycisphaerae bacterium]
MERTGKIEGVRYFFEEEKGNCLVTIDKDGCKYSNQYENRVVQIKDWSSNDVAEYACDALGRRIRMIDKAAEPWKRGLTPLITFRIGKTMPPIKTSGKICLCGSREYI